MSATWPWALEVSEDSVSYVLQRLRSAGLVATGKQGRVVYNRLADNFPEPLRDTCLCRLIDMTPADDGSARASHEPAVALDVRVVAPTISTRTPKMAVRSTVGPAAQGTAVEKAAVGGGGTRWRPPGFRCPGVRMNRSGRPVSCRATPTREGFW